MLKVRAGSCLLAALALLACPGQPRAQVAPATAAGDASGWVQLHSARVRLIAGAPLAPGAKGYLAGVEVALAEGWKTYWRMPGDAGVPPNFDWSGSTNVALVRVLYPAPVRLVEPAAQTVGYKHGVTFPVEIVPKDAGQPVTLRLAMELGICRDICVPAEAKLSLVLDKATLKGAPAAAIRAAMEQVPRPAAARRTGDPEVVQASASLDDAAPRLRIAARFPAGSKDGDLFIEAPDGIYVPLPERLSDAPDGTVRFEVDLGPGGNARELHGKTLTLTLVGEAGASETTWTVP